MGINNYEVFKTTGGGTTFPKISFQINYAGSSNHFISDITFKDASIGWICSDNEILKTTDGGQIWNSQFLQSSAYLSAVFFLDNQQSWVVGRRGSVGYALKTNDVGVTWQTSTFGSTALKQVFFLNASTGWVVSENSSIYKTNDGGANWTAQSSGTTAGLNTIYFSDASNGWVGGNGVLLKTQNGGATWASTFTGYIAPILIKIDNGKGWIVNSSNACYTKDNGQTWKTEDFSGGSASLYSGKVFQSGNLFAAEKTRLKFFLNPQSASPPQSLLNRPLRL